MAKDYDEIVSRVNHTRCPVIRREIVKIARFVDLTGLHEEQSITRFEREIMTIRESSTRNILRWQDGKVIEEGSTHTDWYGYLTSCTANDNPVDYARACAHSRMLGPKSDVVSEAIVTIEDFGAIVPPEWALARSSARVMSGLHYMRVPDDWYLDDKSILDHLAELKRPLSERTFETGRAMTHAGTPITREIVAWSSARTDEENEAAWAEILAMKEASVVI